MIVNLEGFESSSEYRKLSRFEFRLVMVASILESLEPSFKLKPSIVVFRNVLLYSAFIIQLTTSVSGVTSK